MPPSAEVSLDGYPLQLFALRSDTCTALLTDLGARLLEFHAPDRDGTPADVVLGRATLEDTFTDRHYMGSTAGRYAGRIARGRFSLDGEEFRLATNEGNNHLHGGTRGFDQHVWSARRHEDEEAVTFVRVSPHGEEGFPGELTTRVTYRLDGNVLGISMTATTDRATIVRLVHHSYWNLAGHDSGTVLDHVLQLHSSHYVVIDDELLPTGEIASVAGTPFDFRKPCTIGERNGDVANTGAGRVAAGAAGYDHSWVLDGDGMRVVGTLTDPGSGRRLELATDQRALCLYAGGYLAGYTAKGDLGHYAPFAGVTLETTAFPDDVNQPHFPSPVLRPGEVYRNEMRLTFTAE
ncbi:aldose epimerase family protein [Lentzea sp. NPDC059081]|uniref:aldose epimerase family protein n=1 Tax=Lentzea sp. NPDC059081 TaxID=3346719 RepID=UPI0036AD6749